MLMRRMCNRYRIKRGVTEHIVNASGSRAVLIRFANQSAPGHQLLIGERKDCFSKIIVVTRLVVTRLMY